MKLWTHLKRTLVVAIVSRGVIQVSHSSFTTSEPRFRLQQLDQGHHTQGHGSCTSWQWQGRQIYLANQFQYPFHLVSRRTYLPPIKCRPLKNLTSGLGAVRLTSAVGMNELPRPDFGGPFSISHDDGASTEVMGTLVCSSAWMTAGKGSRTSPEKLNPRNLLACDHLGT